MSSPNLAFGRWSEIDRIYSVTTVCRGRAPRFSDAANVECLAAEISRLQCDGLIETIAWVAMPDHVHWLFWLRTGTLSRSVALMKGRSAREIGKRSRGTGAVRQAGYFDHALRHDEAVRRHAEYLLANPIRAGLVSSVSAYAYRWSVWDNDSKAEDR